MPRRRPEPTQHRNPHQLSIRQHVHSRAAVARFSDQDGRVRVRRKSDRSSFFTSPDNPIFCAQRVWSDKLEGGLFKAIEDKFQSELDAVLAAGVVANHKAITAYISIWSIRGDLKFAPLDDIALTGISSSRLTKSEEEILESQGTAYARGGAIPGRMAVWPIVMQRHSRTMHQLDAIQWGVVRTNGSAQFICSDTPGKVLFIPVTPQLALCANHSNGEINDDGVERANGDSWELATEFVFGHPGSGFFLREPVPAITGQEDRQAPRP